MTTFFIVGISISIESLNGPKSSCAPMYDSMEWCIGLLDEISGAYNLLTSIESME